MEPKKKYWSALTSEIWLILRSSIEDKQIGYGGMMFFPLLFDSRPVVLNLLKKIKSKFC